jgi:hypothetical protein
VGGVPCWSSPPHPPHRTGPQRPLRLPPVCCRAQQPGEPMGVVGADRAGKAGTHPGQVISAIIPAQGRVLVVLTFCGGGRGGYRWGGRGILLGLTSVGWAGCNNELLADRLRIFFARSLMLGDGHAARGRLHPTLVRHRVDTGRSLSRHAGTPSVPHAVQPVRRRGRTPFNAFTQRSHADETGVAEDAGNEAGRRWGTWGSFPIASPALLPPREQQQ